jgi:hypothetical protein
MVMITEPKSKWVNIHQKNLVNSMHGELWKHMFCKINTLAEMYSYIHSPSLHLRKLNHWTASEQKAYDAPQLLCTKQWTNI